MASISKSCITKSANIDDNGEPIGVPKICLYIKLSKVKKVEFNINCTAKINSFFVILVAFSICSHLSY